MAAKTEMRKDLHERPVWLRTKMLVRASVLGTSVLGVIACGGDTAGPTQGVNPNAVWSLKFDWPAANLALVAPYDTATIVAVPRTVSGSVADSVVVQYSALDSAVTVAQTGLVTAHFTSPGAHVVAQVTRNGVTLADTALIQVVSTPPAAAIDSLSIQPIPSGTPGALKSTNVYNQVGGAIFIPYFVILTNGDTVCNAVDGCYTGYLYGQDYPTPLVHYATSDETTGRIDQYGYLDTRRSGRVIVTASTLAYGVKKIDSIRVSIGSPRNWAIVDTVDKNQHLYSYDLPRLFAKPWTVGFRLNVYDSTGTQADPQGLVELTIPAPSSGISFLFKPTQQVDTLNTTNYKRGVIEFDSAGTYTIQHRLLSTGETMSQTFTIVPFP